jgi:hypothetical protein
MDAHGPHVDYKNFFELGAQWVQIEVKFLISFNMFNTNFGYVFLS